MFIKNLIASYKFNLLISLKKRNIIILQDFIRLLKATTVLKSFRIILMIKILDNKDFIKLKITIVHNFD